GVGLVGTGLASCARLDVAIMQQKTATEHRAIRQKQLCASGAQGPLNATLD
ncbi:MAG: hypothetical protein RL069_1722, partial [Planctomycetota bacterium]